MSQDLILFLAANPSGTSRLALDEECAAIDRELRLVSRATAMAFIAKWAVTADEMMRHLIELQPTVIHFSGHGAPGAVPGRFRTCRDTSMDDATVRSGIYLQSDNGGSQLVEGRALMKMIRSAASSARIVVLNACYSETQAAAVSGVVDCVVGMTGAIDDEAARSFAVGFYRALGNGRSVGNALDQAGAILAVKHPAYEHLPCCRTRPGIDAERIVLGERSRFALPAIAGEAVATAEPWPQRFEAVVNLCREAHEKLELDPLSAALRARLAIDHITDYLHERELGPPEADEPIDAKMRRFEAKLVIPPMVAPHFESVQVHTSSIIDVARMAVGPKPSFLAPCLDSLAIVVEWFFWEYLAQRDPPRELDGAGSGGDTGSAGDLGSRCGARRRRRSTSGLDRRLRQNAGRR